ncbi:regulatory protein-like protein suaprga1 [Phyllosticta citribraziliensis]|uniref:Regulatory protein-like protein suaprga1 n=1 Tax=Phyllosticta citribraziliensis TaxID=989973 RepID=A0ABR1L3Y9_9PEZI
MLSLRTFARAAPRSISRLATASRLQLSAVARTAAWRSAVAPRLAAFTTSTRKNDTQTLIAKLENEYSIEENVPEPEAYSDTLKDFIENSPFELVDKDGSEDVVLTRKFNNETITVRFTTADINEFPEEEQPNPFEDQALEDEFDGQSGGANTKGSVNKGRTSGGNVKVEPEEEGEYDEGQEEGTTFPAHLNITITKDGQKGALVIDALAEHSAIEISNMFYFPDAKMADPKDPQTDFSRRGIYPGPAFGQLDEDLQLLLDEYLAERGVDATLAIFIPEYIDFKEQKEYLRWLKNVKDFVAA